MTQVGKHIKKYLTELHMTQEDLTDKLYVTRQSSIYWAMHLEFKGAVRFF